MNRPLPLLLILVVMLTSIALGAARGTVRVGTEVVLCTGHGVVVTTLPGDEGTRANVCPDMALSLLAALDPPVVALPPRRSLPQDRAVATQMPVAGIGMSVVRVRGPPVGVSARPFAL